MRLHTDEPSGRMAAARSARAFTVGADIVFGRHDYHPGTATYRALLAHELAHVVQQGDVARADVSDPPIGPTSGRLEHEADAAAGAALAGRSVVVRGRTSGPLLQRAPATPATAGSPSFPLPDGRTLDGTMLESLLLAVPAIAPLVSARMNKGTTAVGHTQFLDPAAFEDRFRAFALPVGAPEKKDPRTGLPFDPLSAKSFAGMVHGFVDRDTHELFVRQAGGLEGDAEILQTSIHEAVHFYASPGFIDYWGFNATEGTTDFFTAIVCNAHKIDPGTLAYDAQSAAVRPILDLGYMTLDEMAEWYFHDRFLFERKHSALALDWAERMKAESYTQAIAKLRRGTP